MDRLRADSEILTFAPDTKSFTELRIKKSQVKFNYSPRVVVHQKRAIFVRITGIAMKSSGDFTKLGQVQASRAPSRSHLPMTGRLSIRERISSTAGFKKIRKGGLSKSHRAWINSRKVSYGDAVEEYLDRSERNQRLLNSEGRPANTPNNVVALEAEARHIDEVVYRNSSEIGAARGRIGEEETVAAIWRDMGIDLVRSKRKPSLLEIVLPEDQKLDLTGRRPGLCDKRKSTLYKLVFGEMDARVTVNKKEKQAKKSPSAERRGGHLKKNGSDINSNDTDDEEFFDAFCDIPPQNVQTEKRANTKTKESSAEIKFKGQTPKTELQGNDKVLPPAPSERTRGYKWRSLSNGTTIGSARSQRQLASNILTFKTSKSSLPADNAGASFSKTQTHQRSDSHKPTSHKSPASVGRMTAGHQKLSLETQLIKKEAQNRGKNSRMPSADTSEREEFFDALEKFSKESLRPATAKTVKLMGTTKLLERQEYFPHSSTRTQSLDIRWHGSHEDSRFRSMEELSETEWMRLKETRQKNKEQRESMCSIN